MPTFVEIAVNVSQLSKTFHSHLSPDLTEQVGQGHLVTVPFGAQTVQGVVLNVLQNSPVSKTKSVIELLDPDPVLTPDQINLAAYLSRQTLSSLAACCPPAEAVGPPQRPTDSRNTTRHTEAV